MNLLQLRNIADYLLGGDNSKVKLTKERFTDLLVVANLEYFEEQVRQKNWDNLRPFTVVRGENNLGPVGVASGIMQYPEDFYQPVSAYIKIPNGTSYRERVMEKVPAEVFDSRMHNPATTPTLRYPVINFQDGFARVRPVTVSKVYLTYLRLPATPLYAQKVGGGVNVYDSANSVELEWSEDCQVDVLRKVMQQLGIRVGRGDIYQVMESKEIKDKQITV